MATVVCPGCGASNTPGSRFCSYCGRALAPPPPFPAAPPVGATPWASAAPTPLQYAPQESPTAAGVLAIIGGVFILLGGIAETLLGAAVSTFTLGQYGAGIIGLGVLGLVLGILVLVMGVLLLTHPDHNVTYGILIIVFSVVSLVCFFGGFLVGFILALIGGILALTWKPTTREAYVYPSPPPP